RAAVSLLARRIEENRGLMGRHSSEKRCFVIGNGPSLKEMDLKRLSEEYTIGANSFYKHPDAEAVGLDYLCIFDPHFMKDEPRAVAIPLALCLGFREIYLIGFDCNWLEDTKKSYHFYESHEQYPEFDSTAKDTRGQTYENVLRSTLREFESHRLLRQKAEQMGV